MHLIVDARGILRWVAIGVLLVTGLVITAVGAVAAPASAAVKPIGLSTDGVTYTDTMPGSLYAGVLIVPGSTVTRTFWVKNRTADAGNLAIALTGVSGADAALVSALSINAAAGSTTGPYVGFPAANPCRSLVSAIPLQPGAAVQVDVNLKLSSSLSGQTSQGSLGKFTIKVTLTSTDVTAPTGCTAVTPPSGGGGGGTPPVTTPPGTIDEVEISGIADGTVPEETTPSPYPSGNGEGFTGLVEPNTGRFWQELDVIGYLIAMVLGGIFAWWRRRRREYISADELGPVRGPSFEPAYQPVYQEVRP